MRYYVLCTSIILAALAVDCKITHHQRLKFNLSHIEHLTSAKFIGRGDIDNDVSPLSHRKIFTTPEKANSSYQCEQKYSCHNCTTSRLCAPTADGTFKQVTLTSCPSDRPYCDFSTGTCVSTTVLKCVTPSNLTCLREEGYFPHPTDCSQFYYCYNYVAYIFKCAYYNYDPYYKSCNNYYCYTFICSGNNGRKYPHPRSEAYFAYCSNNSAVAVDRCDGEETLNTTSQQCEMKCTKEGLMRDYRNCTNYYKCTYRSGYGYVREHKRCDEGCSFRPEEFQCVRGISSEDCALAEAENSYKK